MRKLVVLLFLLVALPAGAKNRERIFHGERSKVWQACVDMAKEHYTIAEANEAEGVLTFWTGYSLTSSGFQVTLMVEAKSPSETRVAIRPAKRQQLFAWGAGGRIADKFFKQVADRLAEAAPRKP